MFSKPRSATLATYIAGLAVNRKSGRTTASSSRDRSMLRTGRPSFSTGCTLSSTADDALRLLVATGLRELGIARVLLLEGLQVRQREFGVDRLDVGDRIDLAGDMDDVVIVEAAHDMRDRVGLADVGEELVAQSFAFRGAGHQARDVHELDRCMQHALRVHDRRELIQARIGQFDDPHIGLDGCRTDNSRPRCRTWSAR